MKTLIAMIAIICFTAIFIVVNIIYLFPMKLSILSKASLKDASLKNASLSNVTTVKTNNDPLFIIIMASFPRKNGKTPYYIKKAVISILSQSYSNWKLYVTGDKHDNESGFRSLFNAIPPSKLFLYNLLEPGERNNLTGMELWESGGVSAMNNALERAEQHHSSCGTTCKIYFTNHDDDDIWSTEHLHELLSIFIRFPSVVFTWTKGYYCYSGGSPYPPLLVPQETVNNWPHGFGGNILHSSWSWDMNVFRGFRYRGHCDFPSNFTGPKAADYDLFEIIRVHVKTKNLDYYHSNRATIEHLSEMGKSCAKNGPLWYPD